MATLTRRALRVYAALSELSGPNVDVLQALIPFFGPVLAVLNGKVFDPHVFAAGIKRLYGWRFTGDIAKQFIEPLRTQGFLDRAVSSDSGSVYIVKYSESGDESALPIASVVDAIIDEFVDFPPRVTDLLSYKRTREQLKDILIRFLVSMDVAGEGAYSAGIGGVDFEAGARELLEQLEEGGTPLDSNDRYMCARFISYLLKTKPAYVPHLSRLASIALLTEVVEDFLKPTTAETASDLTVALDAPLALDYLGCSGRALKDDIKAVIDALKSIGCKFVVFAISCEEMKRNLNSMLALQPQTRHGYTHEAMVRGEVAADFVQAIARNPEKALETAGITVLPLTLVQYPHRERHFTQAQYEDIFESIFWVSQVEPREHDATCAALIMRLREGRQNSDLFRTKYILATRNMRFVSHSRNYCLRARQITSIQEGPVIGQRELATTAWLRTGLGAEESIPRGHLIATCDRVLRVRPEVKNALAAQLARLTPERLEQFNLLMLDSRSMRKLADQTLNDENVVTAENAEDLLNTIRSATADEAREEYERIIANERDRSQEQLRLIAARLTEAEQNEAAANARIREEDDRASAQLDGIVTRLNRRAVKVEVVVTAACLVLGVLGAVNMWNHWLDTAVYWRITSPCILGFGVYRTCFAVLERPAPGVASIMNLVNKVRFRNEISAHRLDNRMLGAAIEFKKGRVLRLTSSLPAPERPPQ